VRLTATDRARLHDVCTFATEALRFATRITTTAPTPPEIVKLALGLEILERLIDSDDERTGDV
jgi:hypothetical protein